MVVLCLTFFFFFLIFGPPQSIITAASQIQTTYTTIVTYTTINYARLKRLLSDDGDGDRVTARTKRRRLSEVERSNDVMNDDDTGGVGGETRLTDVAVAIFKLLFVFSFSRILNAVGASTPW